MRSGFPTPALTLDAADRQEWLRSYVDHVVTRDAAMLDPRRDQTRIRRYFDAVAHNSAGVVDEIALLRLAGIDRRTGVANEQLLVDLGILDLIPAWRTNRIKRLTLRPKRVLIDSALVTAALSVQADDVLTDGDLLGRVIETFVIAQLRAEVASSTTPHTLLHLRTEQGRHEVDLIAELPRGRMIAVEVKATSAPRIDDAKHLIWLRDELGSAFVGGVVFHSGPRVFELADRVLAAPIATLWD